MTSAVKLYYAPWSADPDPPDYMTDEDMAKMADAAVAYMSQLTHDAGYDPNEERDPHGQWTTGGSEVSVGGEGVAKLSNENVFVGKYKEEIANGLDFRPSQSRGVIWKQQGDVKDIDRQAIDATLRLGDSKIEYVTVVAKTGPAAENGTEVMVVGGDPRHCTIPENMDAKLTPDLPGVDSAYDLHHNHPLPYTLSGGDLNTLNNFPAVVSISAHDMDGGSSTARIVGRTYDHPHGSWDGFGYHMADYLTRYAERTDLSLYPETHASGPAIRVRDALWNRQKQDVLGNNTLSVTDDDIQNVPIFLKQHAMSMGLKDRGFIEYEYKFSPWQKKWADQYSKELEDMITIAKEEAFKFEKHWIDPTSDPKLPMSERGAMGLPGDPK